MPEVNKHFDAGARRAAIKLWRAKVPQRAIMKQLGMSKATLMRVFGLCKGQPSRMMRKKPLLTEWMKIHRLEFANAYRHWDEDDWKQVMFSDESQEHGGGNR